MCSSETLKFYEQIDPRHRYGHNLHYYYDCWLRCESKEPFFYWSVSLSELNMICIFFYIFRQLLKSDFLLIALFRLDVGEGKEINLERCPRLKLLSQCIKYLGPVSLHK